MDNNLLQYQKKFKENISLLIESNNLQEAKNLIKEYENIINNDIEIYSFKSVISIMENKLNYALEVLEKGILIDSNNFDLLYNKAYTEEIMRNYKTAYKYYKRCLDISKDEQIKLEIKEKLNYIKSIDSNYELYGNISLLEIEDRLNPKFDNYIINFFHEFGFTILRVIDEPSIGKFKKGIRKLIILYDLDPIEVNSEDKIKYPYMDNGRLLLIKDINKQAQIELKLKNIKNYIYLTKNENEAKEVLENLFKETLENLSKEIRKIEKEYISQYKVIKVFKGFKHKAKTELINYRDGLAVKKTWKPGNEKFFEREKFAYSELSKTIKYIPRLLESGDNYVIIPYYNDVLNKSEQNKKIILTSHIIDVAAYFKQLYDLGYYNPDIHPGQFLYTEKEGVIAIDFEYLQKYEEKPSSLFESYDILGYPKDFNGDKPNYTGQNLHKWYDELWIKYTGYDLMEIAKIAYQKYQENDVEVDRVLGLLNYAKTSGKSYNGSFYNSAYHSLELKGYYFRGQRECKLRLKKIPYDFKGKVVLDIGCNVGGMLHSLSDKIEIGIGLDYDYRLINAANAIKTLNSSNNLSFYMFDLENEDLNLINNYVLSNREKVDICFLLSICMWIKNWKEVIKFISTISDNLLFETNGTEKQQSEQIEELKKYYKNIQLIEKVSNDDPGQPYRMLVLCGIV
ncbi:hypothetical protein [Clostridium botulinum]|uniref:hypothetical protein n=1 Tax=Clostridium botulinum TaxID=1491 RepID=UPI003DA5D6BE